MSQSVEDFAAAQTLEWSQYVAIAPINFGNARAYNVGDPVPASNAVRYGYLEQGLVAKTSSKAAAAAADPTVKKD